MNNCLFVKKPKKTQNEFFLPKAGNRRLAAWQAILLALLPLSFAWRQAAPGKMSVGIKGGLLKLTLATHIEKPPLGERRLTCLPDSGVEAFAT